MKINPIAHGNHDNVWFNVVIKGITLKVCGFYESGDAYVTKSVIKRKSYNLDTIYNTLKSKLEEQFDFYLKTPKNKILKHKFSNTESLLNYVRVCQKNI